MKLSIRLLIILITMTPLLSACWNSRELNELAITTAIGIDKSEKGYQLTVQIINPTEVSKEKTGRRTSVTTISESGKTLFEVFRKMTTVSSRKLYVSHVRILVIGEDFAREGTSKLFDLLMRDHEFRSNFYLLISKEQKASDVLSILTSMDEIPGDKLYTSLITSTQAYGTTTDMTIDDFVTDMKGNGKNPAVTGVSIIGDKQEGEYASIYDSIKPETLLKLVPLSVFRGDKLVGWMNAKESRGYNFADGNIKSTLVNVPCINSEGIFGIEVIKSEAKITAKMRGEQVTGLIKVKIKGNAMDDECTEMAKLDNPTYLNELEKNMNKTVKSDIRAAIEMSQTEVQSDILGIGEAVHRSNPKIRKHMEEKWKDIYPDVPIRIQVQTEIVNTGSITNSPQGGG